MRDRVHRCGPFSRLRVLVAVVASGVVSPLTALSQEGDGKIPTASGSMQGSVSGHVRDSAGRPLGGVLVTLGAPPPRAERRVDTTGATGRFELARVRAGSYVVTFERDSFVTRRLSVSVGDSGVTLDVVLSHGAADGAASELQPVIVTARAAPPRATVGALPDVRGAEIFAGKKTETIEVDSLAMNSAQDVSRQLFSRAPGANITETASGGFPSNGIAFRGLNPVQSAEMNVRQDGVNIVADLYGYPETYYTPPAEAMQRVELVRGSSSLQFGPQFGGVIDYVLRDGAPHSSLSMKARETGGSFGMFNSYLSLEGGKEKWTYFAYGQYRSQNGWRPNSDLSQVSAAGKLTWHARERLSLGLSYSLLRNRIHMPGGLDDAQFDENARASYRARNWLASPWNIVALDGDYELSASTRITSSLSFMRSQRYLVWRNEDGGPSAIDGVDPETNDFVPRELEREYFTNLTNETRLIHSYDLFGQSHAIAAGFRIFGGDLHRQEGGPGSTGSDFDMQLAGGPYETDMKFGNFNSAAFAENEFRITPRLSITPGARVEFLHSTARGHTDTIVAPQSKNRTFVLFGAGAQYQSSASTSIYANATQAYRPIEYSYLTPFASLTRIDPKLQDPKGYNIDLGWRGSLGEVLQFDVGLFDLVYRNRIGLVSGVDSAGAPFTERTNVATSAHRGVEAYVNVSLTSLLRGDPLSGSLDLYDAFGYTHARYTSGEFAGNSVEYAPTIVNRAGLTYTRGRGTLGLQWSYVSRQFTDANNTVASEDADIGVVPAYQLVDLSAKWQLTRMLGVDFGVNNVANRSYFTMRTAEYPGPGIIPGVGRSFYAGVRAGF
jgi:Fe(3+) dicitrate transport protein